MAAILIGLFILVLAMMAGRILAFVFNNFWTIIFVLIVGGFIFYAHYGPQ